MKEGYKKTKLGWIPEEWEVTELNKVTSYVDYRGKTPPKVDSGIFLVTAKNIRNGKINYDFSKEYVPVHLYDEIMSRGIPKIGDVLITTEAPMGEVAAINKTNIALAQRIIKYRGNENSLSNDYLKYCFLSSYFQSNLEKNSTGSTVKGIKGSRLHKQLIPLPPLPEQKKIAQILTTLDSKIDHIEAQITQTQTLKKGLMQQLLTKGIGHTEFKDSPLGEIPKSWEVVKLGKTSKINESSITKEFSEEYEMFYIDLSAVKNGKISFPNEKIKLKNAPSRARRILKNGDVIIATVRPNLLGYAFADFPIKDMICSTGFALVSPNQKITEGKFIYQSIYSTNIQNQINKLLVGSNYPAINSSDISNLKLPLPPLPEQKKIAQILSTVDSKIDLLENKRSEYQELKKGMMQVLLTGEVRVKV